MGVEERCGAWMRYKKAPCALVLGHTGQHRPAEALSDQSPDDAAKVICGKWMPRKETTCARRAGHGGEHRTAQALANTKRRRLTERQRGELLNNDPAARARWNRKSLLARYGLTQEAFTQLLAIQEHACAMCREPFADGQQVFIDHDHACCPDRKRTCGNCVRGLLCLRCNTGLGYVERMQTLAQAYLDAPPAALRRALPQLA
jgi:Recombination endonuclease VII